MCGTTCRTVGVQLYCQKRACEGSDTGVEVLRELGDTVCSIKAQDCNPVPKPKPLKVQPKMGVDFDTLSGQTPGRANQ